MFVCAVSRLAEDRPMSPQFRKVHRPLLLPITDKFPEHQYCLRCLSVWCRFVLDDLWNAVVCFQRPSLLIGKVWVPVMHFCSCPIHCRVHWRVGRRLRSCRLTSVQLLESAAIGEWSRVNRQGILYKLCSGYWRFCPVFIDTVSIKPITASYGGWLSK